MEKDNNKSNKILKIVFCIVLIGIIFGIGLIVGKKLYSNEEQDNDVINVDDEGQNDEAIFKAEAIDKEEAPNPVVVSTEKIEGQTTTTKPNYTVDVDEYRLYKDGFLGYYSSDFGFGTDVMPDTEEETFIKLYECKNKEYGKCGIAETLGVTGDYNLEQGLKIASDGFIFLDERYILLYDSELYQQSTYMNMFSKEAPLIIYDTELKKEVIRLAGVYSKDISATADNLIGISLEGKYGVFDIVDGEYKEIIPFKYDYIGVLYNADEFMLVKDNRYYVYNPKTNKTYGPYNNQISQYSKNFIITNEGNYLNDTEKNYRLYTIDGKKLLTESSYEYMDIAGDLVIVIDKNKSLNVYDINGKAILAKPQEKVIGAYHVRCCAARMAYYYEIVHNTLEIIVLSEANGHEEMFKYVINIKDKTYTSEVYISEE